MDGGRDRRTAWIVAMIIVIVASVATIGVVALHNNGSSPAAASVTLEPATSTGTDPFTSSVAIGPVVRFPGNVRAIAAGVRNKLPTDPTTHTHIAVGIRPGLYGGTNNAHVCDPRQLVTYLRANPDKANAWAHVLDVAPDRIAAYVATLTPVVLTADTRVTNHGYRDGRATTLQSVLQAGTAVMVDATGTPRVKCNCGNPLTPPQPITLTTTDTRGTPWPGYQPADVVTVKPGPSTTTLTLLDTQTGDPYQQAAGNPAPGSTPLTTPPTQPTVTSGTGTNGAGEFVAAEIADQAASTTIVSQPRRSEVEEDRGHPERGRSRTCVGSRGWIAVADGPTGRRLLASRDLHTWTPIPGIADTVNGVAYNNGLWIAVGDSLTTQQVVIYTSADGEGWTRRALPLAGSFLSVAYGDGMWIAVAADNGALILSTSRDGITWSAPTRTVLAGASEGHVAFGNGEWMVGASRPLPRQGSEDFSDGALGVSHDDGHSWRTVSSPLFGHNALLGIAYGNGGWLAVGASEDQPVGFHGNPSATFFSSRDGKTWSRIGHVDPSVWALAFGGGRVQYAPSTTTASTTTTTTSTTPPSRSTVPPAPPGRSAAPPCSLQLMQASIDAAPPGPGTWQLHSVRCSGDWAVAFGVNGRDDVTPLFQWTGTAWAVEADPSVCTSGVVPTANQIRHYACGSG